MLSFKKLMYFSFIGFFVFDCFAMNNPQTQQDNNNLSITTLNDNQQNKKIPMHEITTWDELVKAKGWKTGRDISKERQERIFNSLPLHMQTILENFNENDYIEQNALLLESPLTMYNSVLTCAIAKHCKNISGVFLSADSLFEQEHVTEEQDSTSQNITHLFSLAKKETNPLLITIDKINALFQKKSNNHPEHQIIDTLIQEIDNLNKEEEEERSTVFFILTTDEFNNCPKAFINQFNYPFSIKEISSCNQTRNISSETNLNPFEQAKTLDELIKKKAWKTKKDISPEHAKIIFESLPDTMKTRLEQFANSQSYTTHPYWHALLLVGAPGTGKSTAGFAVAQHLNIKHFSLPATTLTDAWKNSGTTNIMRLIKLAKKEKKKILISIDEIPALLNRYKSEHNNPDPGILENFLEAIESIEESNVFLILTTNGLDDYPYQFTDRFNGNTIIMSNPTKEARSTIIDHLLKKYGFGFELQGYLLNKTSSLSYREIVKLFQHAFDLAQKGKAVGAPFKPFTQQHFDLSYSQAISSRPSTILKKIKRGNTFCKDYGAIIGTSIAVLGFTTTCYFGRKQIQAAAQQLIHTVKQYKLSKKQYKLTEILGNKQLDQGAKIAADQLAQAKDIATKQFTQQQTLANKQMGLQIIISCISGMGGFLQWFYNNKPTGSK